MRAAIVHFWLDRMRGGEKVVEAICRLLPDADIFTLFCDTEKLSPEIRRHNIHTSFLQPLRRYYRNLLPLMPMALESFDLREYDLIVSSESGPAKGVLSPSRSRHVCYCHSPMRYLWELYPAYRNEWTRSRLKRAVMAPLTNYLRLWDYSSAARVDQFIANSQNVQNRIWKTYRRQSEVIYPPVAVDSFYWKPSEDYYLIASELVAYKRIDSAVRVFARNGRKLCIVGDGPEYKNLRNGAPANIQFLGHVTDCELQDLYARSRAFLMPGEEDFGMTAVEALASGKPVIALGRGGACEVVPLEPLGGVLYRDPEDSALADAILRFEQLESSIDPELLQSHAARFSDVEFDSKMSAVLFEARTFDNDFTPVLLQP